MSFPRLATLLLPLALGLPLLTGACGVPLAVTGASYGADGVSMAETGKTSSDHLASIVSKEDCALWRAFRNQTVCRPREGKDPYNTDYATPNRVSTDSGVEYEAPARSGSDAPAFAWDATSYKKGEATPPVTVANTVTTPAPANVEAAPTPPPQAIPSPPAKKKKSTHTRSTAAKQKKPAPPVATPAPATPPSPDRAASAL